MATSRCELDAGRAARTIERYVALGDSFTAGVEGGGPRWADRLAELLREPNRGLEYRNLAVAGALSTEVARDQLPPALRVRPDLVTLVCGANDVLLSVRPDMRAHAAALDGMLARLRTELPRAAVVTGTTPDLADFVPLGPRARRRVSRGISELNAVTRAIAVRHRIPCLEFERHPGAHDRRNFAADGIHPSPQGHRRAAAGFARALASNWSIDVSIPEEEP